MPKILPGEIKVDPEDKWLIEQFGWRKRSDGYVIRSVYIGWVDGKYRYKRVYLHRVITNARAGEIVDHINGDPLDNRRCNLRVVTQNVNMRNASCKIHSRNTSGYRGVTRDKRRNKWMARAKMDGKEYFIGYYDTAQKAGEAAHDWRVKHMPGYTETIDPAILCEYISKAKPKLERKWGVQAEQLCACGCGRIVRNPHRAMFAHGGRPKRPHGTLPPGVQIDASDRILLLGHSWHITSSGYIAARIDKKIVLLHRLILSAPPSLVVDHINGDPLDNRRCNLRLATMRINGQNIRLTKANTSGYRGVTWDEKRKKWMAQARASGRRVYLGRYDKIEDAAEASHRWRLEHMPGYCPDWRFND